MKRGSQIEVEPGLHDLLIVGSSSLFDISSLLPGSLLFQFFQNLLILLLDLFVLLLLFLFLYLLEVITR